MATITSASSSSYENTSRRSYISTDIFEYDFWTYTTSVNPTTFVTTGTLTLVAAAAGVSPRGRVLRETGRKLVPGANPGVTVYMVEVFDNTTFLRGYINPNSPVFAPFNSDKPAFMEEPYVINQDVSGGSYGTPGAFAGLQNLGSSVLTRGNVNVDGYIETGGQIRCIQQQTLRQTTNNQVISLIPAVSQTFYIEIGNGGPGSFTTTIAVPAGSYSVGDRITIYAKLTAGISPNTCSLAFPSDFIMQTSNTITFTGTSGSVATSKFYSITFQAYDTTGATPQAPANKLIELSRIAF